MPVQKKNNNKKKSQIKSGTLIAGAIGVATVAGVGGYTTGILTARDIQDFNPKYTVNLQELKEAKLILSSIQIRMNDIEIPDYDSKTMPGWYDSDHNGCPTRYDILTRDALNQKTNESTCEFKSGTMFDYYTGTLVKYNKLVNGGGIDIDHIVAKGNAWVSGGYVWSGERWKEYINDEEVLIATSAKINRSKGDKDASEWLPPNEDFWCKYVIKQTQIKHKYHLNISSNEKSTIENILSTKCKTDQ